MDVSKEVEFRKKKTRAKIIVGGVVAAVLLLGVVVFVAVYFTLPKRKPDRLVEIDLKEGESLTYRVDQHIKLHGSDGQKANIRAIIGIQVLNKTSEEYWFLMKSNLSQLGQNVSSKGHNITTDYFLVRLHISSRPSSPTSSKTSESFEVFGPRDIHPELLRQVYSILMQLLPDVHRDLYEDVDGEKATGSNSPDPEDSPLLPGSVKMHRQADTLHNENVVFIGNNFNRADFVNLASEIDFDFKYSYSAFVSKSNGMITQSNASFTKQLNFGEPIHYKSGDPDKMLKVSMTSQVSLVELTSYFEQGEFERVRVYLFVRLSLPKAKATFSHNLPTDAVSNLTLTHNSTNSSGIQLQRSRRSPNLDVDYSETLFEKKVLGITVKAVVRHWVQQGVKMGISVVLSIGSYNQPIFREEKSWNELQNQQPTDTSRSWSIKSISFSIPVDIFSIGVDFSLKVKLDLSKSYPPSPSSSSRKFAVQIKPHAEVTATIEGYLSAHVIKAGVHGDGTIVDVGLPVTLSLQVYPSENWCATMSADLTALELNADLYYKLCIPFFHCGSRKTVLRFGTWDAIRRNWKLMTRCN